MGLIFQCPSRLNVSQSLTPFGSGTTIREQDSRTTAVATVRPYATFLELPTTIRGSKRIAKKGFADYLEFGPKNQKGSTAVEGTFIAL